MKNFFWIGLLLLGTFASIQAKEPVYLNVVYIGNSITYGAWLMNPRKEAPPVQASIYLQKQTGIKAVRFSNQGVSGLTTVDFLPKSDTYFNKVIEAADQFKNEDWAQLVFSIMLGTNDSAMDHTNGAPVSTQAYKENMKQIIEALLQRYPTSKIVLHKPLWYSPNTYNGARYLEEGLKRLQTYYPVLVGLVKAYATSNPHQVMLGDTQGYAYFEKNHTTDMKAEEGHAGTFYLHPNAKGAKALGCFWGKAINNIL